MFGFPKANAFYSKSPIKSIIIGYRTIEQVLTNSIKQRLKLGFQMKVHTCVRKARDWTSTSMHSCCILILAGVCIVRIVLPVLPDTDIIFLINNKNFIFSLNIFGFSMSLFYYWPKFHEVYQECIITADKESHIKSTTYTKRKVWDI